MDFQIKKVTLKNWDIVLNCHEDVFDDEVKETYLKTFLENPMNLLLVALHQKQVVGMASGIIYNHPDKNFQLFINEVGVAEPFQKKGIGKKLMAALLEEGEREGCTEAWVATEENNHAARALYLATKGQKDEDKAVVYTWAFSEGLD